MNDNSDGNPVAVVTGSRRGIGRAIALALMRDGYFVVFHGASDALPEDLEAEARAVSGSFTYISADVGIGEGRGKIIELLEREYPGVDVLVNNAGIAPASRVDLLETDPVDFRRVLGVNLEGPFFLSVAVAKLMLRDLERRGEVGAGAKVTAAAARKKYIVNVSSISAYASSPNRPAYCISKAGLGMVTKLFADRLASAGIRVYEVRPGIIKTDMTARVSEKYDELISGGLTPIRRWGLPGDVARAVAALCSGAFDFSTGEVVNVDGGFHLRRL
ncbi:MAG: 3-ketoacyl-ACP reductase [Promethearchaeota archaeon]